MSNSSLSGEKATKEEARKTLMTYLADNWTGTFGVDFWSDGGGMLIRAIVEVDDTDKELSYEFRHKFPPKWMGWRLVVLKVTLGYIDVFIKK